MTIALKCILSACTCPFLLNQLYLEPSLQDADDPDPGEVCPGPRGNVTQYQIKFENDTSVQTFIVNSTMCRDRTCNYTFEPPSNPPSSYDRVSVVAENVVGTGDARNLTTQPISELSVIMYQCILNDVYHVLHSVIVDFQE